MLRMHDLKAFCLVMLWGSEIVDYLVAEHMHCTLHDQPASLVQPYVKYSGNQRMKGKKGK